MTRPPKRIIVASPMKAGSTYVARTLGRCIGASFAEGLDYDWLSEQNPRNSLLKQLRGRDFTLNLHLLPHASNLRALAEERVLIWPLWRNLADMVVSFDDHIPRYGAHNPVFYAPHDALLRMAPQARYRFIIDGLTPWNLGFYLRWRDLQGACFQSYETMVADPVSFFRFALWRLGFAHDDAIVAASLNDDPRAGRFNAGRVGRAAEMLNEENRRRLECHVTHHPRFDELEVLLWELPWPPTEIERRSELDGRSVRDRNGTPWFVSRGIRHRVAEEWLVLRAASRLREPREVGDEALRALPEGIALM